MEEITVYGGKPTFANKLLQRATDDIFKVADTMRKCALRTAAIMATVEASECYKEDGFDSVHQWSQETFGFKKSASYTLLRIGKEYIREVKNPETGKIKGYTTNLLPEDSEIDFSVTQIEKMLPLGHSGALELVEAGEIKPTMTCREIGDVVKEYLKEDTSEDENEPAESDNLVDAGEGEKIEMMTLAIVFADGSIGEARYSIPADVLKDYKVEIS